MLSAKFIRSYEMMRHLCAATLTIVAVAMCATSANADVSGGIGGPNVFSGFTINEGQSGTVILQLNMNGQNAGGGAGTTTNRIINGTPLTFVSSGAVTTPTNPAGATAGGGTTANWNATFQYNLPGVYNVSYGGNVTWSHLGNPSYSTGTDGGNGVNGVGGNLNVTVNNVAPVIQTANLNGTNGNISVGQGSAVTANMTATDAGSQTTTFTINGGGAGSASAGPGGVRTSSNVGLVSPAVGLAPGVYAQTFQATDASGANASNGPFVRNVTVTNVGPTITSANLNGTNGNISVNQGAALSLNLTATDPGNDTMSFTINGGAAGSTGVAAGGSARTSSTVSGNTVLAPGVYTQTFTATDQYAAGATTTRLVTIVNVGPSVTAARVNGVDGNGTIAQGNAASLNMSATDPGGDAVTYTINGGAAGGSASGGNSSNVSTGVLLAPGVYTQTYQAADGFGGSSGVVTRNVTVTNVGPTITSANANGTNGDISVGQGAGVTLNMTATDPGNDTMSFTINGGAAGSTGVQAGGSTRTSSNVGAGGSVGLAPGVYTQTYTATDQYGSSATSTRNVTVTNVAPTITSANQNGVNGNITVLQGASVTLNLTATDPGNDTMSFTVNGGGAGSTGVQAGGSTRTSADNSVQYFTPGVFTNTFQATDQYGANALNGPQTHDVTVINVAPVITSLIISEIPNILGNGCLHFFTATSSDPGIFDSAIYSWDLNGDNIFGDYVSTDPAPPWSSTTPTNLYGLGTHTIGVMVTDNWGGFDPVNGVAYLTFECLPEPSTWVAILLSGGALAFFHRRKKRKT